MTSMSAYLDDFGKITIWMNKNFYSGRVDTFYLLGEHGDINDLLIAGVEEHDTAVKYSLTAPADMSFGTDYKVRENHGLSVPLIIRMIVHTPEFNRRFFYEGDDLGAVYHRMHTDFALWAPTAVSVTLRVRMDGKIRVYPMDRGDRGVYRTSVVGDLKKALYVYLVERNGAVVKTLDPYALSSTGNANESAVIDPEEIRNIPDVKLEESISGTDAVIYETSIRDMTSSILTGTHTHSKYTSLCETGTSYKGMPTGLDYLASLGITHVQLMPVLDFCTVDEFHPEKNYNWGYDIMQYLSPEGSYSSNPDDPYARMKELKQLVSVFHSKKLRVNLDVVFNHVYDADGSCFGKTVPYYYFRYNESGYLSNGSYCGNDFASDQPMARKFLVHVIRTLMETYDVDGFRFDLMGILDVDTMNAIHREALSVKKDAMIYGEGWDMPTILDWQKKADIANQNVMPGIGHFNDYYRDTVKGRNGDDQKYEKGYITGDLGQVFGMLSALSANVMGDPLFKRFEEPDQSVNNIETHDNATVWDKMRACCSGEDRATRQKRQKMLIGSLMVSQGIAFMHGGMEFCGTKNDNSNSYNADDKINGMDWERASINSDIIAYTRKAIALRRNYPEFRLKTSQKIQNQVRLSTSDGGIVFYDVNEAEDDRHADTLFGVRVLINPSFEGKHYVFEPGWKIIFDENGNGHEEVSDQADLPPLSLIVLVRVKN